MTPEEKRHWHWAEGNKYALEGMKTLLLLNGGAAVLLLTFIGNRNRPLLPNSSEAVGNALVSFSIGTTGSFVLFLMAYLTQLQYGNKGAGTAIALALHYATYAAVLVGLGGFLSGIWASRAAVISILAVPS